VLRLRDLDRSAEDPERKTGPDPQLVKSRLAPPSGPEHRVAMHRIPGAHVHDPRPGRFHQTLPAMTRINFLILQVEIEDRHSPFLVLDDVSHVERFTHRPVLRIESSNDESSHGPVSQDDGQDQAPREHAEHPEQKIALRTHGSDQHRDRQAQIDQERNEMMTRL
jgi:hypothetical protein